MTVDVDGAHTLAGAVSFGASCGQVLLVIAIIIVTVITTIILVIFVIIIGMINDHAMHDI